MGHDSQVNSVEFSHKNQLIVSSSDDGTARVWRPGKVDCAAVSAAMTGVALRFVSFACTSFVEGGVFPQASPCKRGRSIATEEKL